MTPSSFNVVGMMSGTSLDGLDLVLCNFRKIESRWEFQIIKAETFIYPEDWVNKLKTANRLDALEFLKLHNAYGAYIGKKIREFLAGNKLDVHLVSSHGHTIFHQPSEKLTCQIGSGAFIAAECKITTVSDFRSLDVALGGQGAPLVPVGDVFLFGNYEFCMNLGGFANISNASDNRRVAFDICPVNIVANDLAKLAGFEYDKDGLLGRKGKIIPELVYELNALSYYSKSGPKSLGREWLDAEFLPVVHQYNAVVPDLLRSIYEHAAIQISNYINAYSSGKVLVTGGGAFNIFFMELLTHKTNLPLILPEKEVIKFKEALIFAFLGLLRFLHEPNCLASVTGAKADSSTGTVYRIG